jgi:hypothetical protein
MSTIYCVHAATSVGRTEVKAASHATIDEALSEAASALSSGSAFVWIVDEEGNLILPPDQVKARLGQSARAPQDFAS